MGISIGGPTFNCDRYVPVLSPLTDLVCDMANAEQATQIRAVQDQKLTAQTGGGILPPPATSHSIKRDCRQDSVELP